MVTRAASRPLAFLLSIALLAVTAGAAAAATTPFPQDFSFDERGVRADAYWQTCEEPDSEGVTHCVTVSASLFDGRQHNRDPEFGHVNDAFSYLCVFRQEEAFAEEVGLVDQPISEGGCVTQPDITVDGLDLVEASGTLDLVQWICVIVDPDTGETICEPGPSRTVSVDLTITGTGDLLTDRWVSNGTSIVDGVRCHMRSASAGTGRDAVASIQFGDEDPGASQYAFLVDGRTRMAQRCAG
jgi:hypothetical protein